jgi:hypothetical protein
VRKLHAAASLADARGSECAQFERDRKAKPPADLLCLAQLPKIGRQSNGAICVLCISVGSFPTSGNFARSSLAAGCRKQVAAALRFSGYA